MHPMVVVQPSTRHSSSSGDALRDDRTAYQPRCGRPRVRATARVVAAPCVCQPPCFADAETGSTPRGEETPQCCRVVFRSTTGWCCNLPGWSKPSLGTKLVTACRLRSNVLVLTSREQETILRALEDAPARLRDACDALLDAWNARRFLTPEAPGAEQKRERLRGERRSSRAHGDRRGTLPPSRPPSLDRSATRPGFRQLGLPGREPAWLRALGHALSAQIT